MDLLRWHERDGIIFSDEKMFVVQLQFNVQNDKEWSVSLRDILREELSIPRHQNASEVMFWGAMSASLTGFYR
jgi:hypothetical protein